MSTGLLRYGAADRQVVEYCVRRASSQSIIISHCVIEPLIRQQPSPQDEEQEEEED